MGTQHQTSLPDALANGWPTDGAITDATIKAHTPHTIVGFRFLVIWCVVGWYFVVCGGSAMLIALLSQGPAVGCGSLWFSVREPRRFGFVAQVIIR